MLRTPTLVLASADASMQHGLARPGLPEEDVLAQAACIFSDVVSLRIRLPGRDEYVAAVTVRLRPDNPVHPRSLLLELTDESDLFFYHSLLLGEGDFHTLKTEQHLLVEFQSFPAQLVELLRRCMDSPDSPPRSPSDNVNGTSNMQMKACLDCSSCGDSTLSIIESNQFRELTYIALRLRQGTDETVKKHLATKLRLYRTESADFSDRWRLSEETVNQLRRQAEELSTRVRVASEEHSHKEITLESAHTREVAEIRQEHARAIVELQQTANQERCRIEADLKHSLSKMTDRAETAERLNDELQQQQLTLTSSGKGFRERFEASEVQLQELRHELKIVREQQKQLELLKYQHEREIGERGVQLASLQEQLVSKEQLITNQAGQLEQGSAQRKSNEDSLSTCRQQVSILEEKFGLSAQEIAKGNQIIQQMRADGKQVKAKLRLKAEALSQQEKSVSELERAGENGRHVVEEKAQELFRSKDREERLRLDIEDLRKKLAEAHEVLKSNHDVIEYLNRQLTERDLKSLPPVMAGLAGGSEREPRSNALTDLLKRTESLGKGYKPMSFQAGAGFSPNSTNYNLTGLSDLGLTSGSLGLPGVGFGMGASTGQISGLLSGGLSASAATLPGYGLSGSALGSATFPSSSGAEMHSIAGGTTAASHSLGLGLSAASQASAAASIASGRDPLSGPVAYRSPSSPIAVK